MLEFGAAPRSRASKVSTRGSRLQISPRQNAPLLLLATLLWAATIAAAPAMDVVRFKDGDTERRVVGQILVEAEDGGMMLRGRDTRIWIVQPADLIAKEKNDEPFS